jgi:hypothetical protein
VGWTGGHGTRGSRPWLLDNPGAFPRVVFDVIDEA